MKFVLGSPRGFGGWYHMHRGSCRRRSTPSFPPLLPRLLLSLTLALFEGDLPPPWLAFQLGPLERNSVTPTGFPPASSRTHHAVIVPRKRCPSSRDEAVGQLLTNPSSHAGRGGPGRLRRAPPIRSLAVFSSSPP